MILFIFFLLCLQKPGDGEKSTFNMDTSGIPFCTFSPHGLKEKHRKSWFERAENQEGDWRRRGRGEGRELGVDVTGQTIAVLCRHLLLQFLRENKERFLQIFASYLPGVMTK